MIPGLKGLSRQLTMSLSQTSTSGPSLSQSLESDLALYETKAALYLNKFSNQAKENDDGVKELPAPECPLRFWFGQVQLPLSQN